MKNLQEILETENGRTFLKDNGVYLDTKEFADSLDRPRNANCSEKFVYGAQQLYLDYGLGVTLKIAALKELEQLGVATDFIWIDTDKAGSDKLITRFLWPGIMDESSKGYSVVSVKRSRSKEIRFVELDKRHIENTRRSFAEVLKASEIEEDGRIFTNFWRYFQSAVNLQELNLSTTYFLLYNYFDYTPRSMLSSKIKETQSFKNEVNRFIAQIDDVIFEANKSVERLVNADINPQVHEFGEDYLPLFVTCESDLRRQPLRRVKEGFDSYGVANCNCGNEMKFYLGKKDTLSADDVFEKENWSPDVTLPIYINDSYSGAVVGKSSALYGIVLNDVMKNVLGKDPIPMLVSPVDPRVTRDIGNGLIPFYFTKSELGMVSNLDL